jgi:P27 family predicted phage terminase small subunit
MNGQRNNEIPVKNNMTAPKPAAYVPPKAPKNLGKVGRSYWKRVVFEFTVEGCNLDLLESACKQLDRADAAIQVIKRDGVTITNPNGKVEEHPAVKTERAALLAFTRIQREMGLGVKAPETRGPRRPGT